MSSVWSETSKLSKFARLEGEIKTDVLIIGGGMAGILCAHLLTEYGVNYVLVEADTICSGITKNTTAKITFQHGLIYDKLIRQFGIEKAQMYLEANEIALKKYHDLCMNINCDFESKNAFVYSLDNQKKIENELTALNKIGFHAEFCDKTPLPFSIVGSASFLRSCARKRTGCRRYVCR